MQKLIDALEVFNEALASGRNQVTCDQYFEKVIQAGNELVGPEIFDTCLRMSHRLTGADFYDYLDAYLTSQDRPGLIERFYKLRDFDQAANLWITEYNNSDTDQQLEMLRHALIHYRHNEFISRLAQRI